MGALRNDLLAGLTAQLSGILAYFVYCELELGTGMRLSNANRYLPVSGILDTNSESRLNINGRAALVWSPNRYFQLDLAAFASQSQYLGREALTETGALLGETLSVFKTGGALACDLTPDNVWYFLLGVAGWYRFANDPAEQYWNFELHGEIQIAL